jgi:hypothetical protein
MQRLALAQRAESVEGEHERVVVDATDVRLKDGKPSSVSAPG